MTLFVPGTSTMKMISSLISILIILTVIFVKLFTNNKSKCNNSKCLHSDSSIIEIIKVQRDTLGLLTLYVRRKSVYKRVLLFLKLIQSQSYICLNSIAVITIKKSKSSNTSSLTIKILSKFQDSITMMMISTKTNSKSRIRKESILKISFLV